MRLLPVLLALLALLLPALAQAGPPPLEAAAAYAGPRSARVTATLPPGAVQLCASVGGAATCRSGQAGEAVAVTVGATPGAAIAAWAGDRPYVVGGVGSVLGYAELTAPGHVARLPAVITGATP